MAKGSSDYDYVESDNWNIADKYTTFIIFKHISNLDRYKDIAKFGIDNFDLQFRLDDHQRNVARIQALSWYINELEKLIRDTAFAIKGKTDPGKLKKLKGYVLACYKHLDSVKSSRTDQRNNTRVTTIHEKRFNVILNILIDIHEQVLPILNNSDLIFRHTEEFDPAEYKKRRMERFVNEG